MPMVEGKEAARYTDSGTPEEHCSICIHWAPGATSTSPGICRVVAGDILETGWCRHFRHFHEAAE